MNHPNLPPSQRRQPRSAWGPQNSAWGQPSNQWQQEPQQEPLPTAPRGRPSDEQPGQQPLGQHNQPSISIDQFRSKRNRTGPIALALAAILIFAGILYFGLRPDALGGQPTPTPTPSRTAPRTPPSVATAGEFANSIAFQSSDLSGRFTINDSRWQSNTLIVELTIEVNSGTLSYDFLAMDMTSGDVTVPDASAPGDLRSSTLGSGGHVTGTIRFTKQRGDTQILLGTTGTSALAMLAVKG